MKKVALTESVPGASEKLDATPPAVTLQLQQLEEQVGLPSLDQCRQGFRKADAGTVIFE